MSSVHFLKLIIVILIVISIIIIIIIIISTSIILLLFNYYCYYYYFQMASHVSEKCLMTVVLCPYSEAGCPFEVMK